MKTARSHQTTLILAAILLAAAGWKALLLAMEAVPFNADEAVVALMARHMLNGARPVFFYGQAYMGSLDALLVALGFAVFGQAVWVVRLVQALLYLATIITTVGIGKLAFGSVKSGLMAAALMAIPAVNVTLYTTASLGGYGEALLIGNFILLAGFAMLRTCEQYAKAERVQARIRLVGLAGLLGLLAGGGLWANGLTLVYSVPTVTALAWAAWKRRGCLPARWFGEMILSGLAGFVIGSSPWWIYALQNGWAQLLAELTGSAVAVEQGTWVARSLNHLISLVVLGGTATLGLRPPWEVRWLALPLLPFVLAFWIGVIVYFARQALYPNPQRTAYRILAGVVLTLSAGFVFTHFGVDPSGRYFLPFTVPLALAAGHMIISMTRKLHWQLGLVGLALVFNLWGTLQVAQRYPPGITTQFDLNTAVDHRYDRQLIQFLQEQGEFVGYTTYWVAYPLAFLSQEELIFVPRLPYHADLRYTERDDRYSPYTQLVANANRAAYITARNPALDDRLRAEFARLEITWSEHAIGDYRVYYQLSRPVRPTEVGFGQTTSFIRAGGGE